MDLSFRDRKLDIPDVCDLPDTSSNNQEPMINKIDSTLCICNNNYLHAYSCAYCVKNMLRKTLPFTKYLERPFTKKKMSQIFNRVLIYSLLQIRSDLLHTSGRN